MKTLLNKIFIAFRLLFFDPREPIYKWIGIPYYVRNIFKYNNTNIHSRFKITLKNIMPMLGDRFFEAGSARGHYFWQDIWAAKYLYENRPRDYHVDIGSRLDGFIGHILAFTKVQYIDIRDLSISIDNLEFIKGSIINLPYDDSTISSLSSLHVIEHIGLGRYGDPIMKNGHELAAKELVRVLSDNGRLLIGVPIGKERLCFDAHRIFDPETIIELFRPLRLREFSLIDDEGNKVIKNASYDIARKCDYGCGLFVFEKSIK